MARLILHVEREYMYIIQYTINVVSHITVLYNSAYLQHYIINGTCPPHFAWIESSYLLQCYNMWYTPTCNVGVPLFFLNFHRSVTICQDINIHGSSPSLLSLTYFSLYLLYCKIFCRMFRGFSIDSYSYAKMKLARVNFYIQ